MLIIVAAETADNESALQPANRVCVRTYTDPKNVKNIFIPKSVDDFLQLLCVQNKIVFSSILSFRRNSADR